MTGVQTCALPICDDAWGWCTGTTQRDGMGREEGGGFRMDFLLKRKKKKKKKKDAYSLEGKL